MVLILLSIYLTDYSIATLHAFIQIFLIFCTKIKHPSCFFPWALPTPGLWNKDGDSGIPFRVRCPRLSFLQILGQPLSIEDCQLVEYLVPVPVSLCPLLRHIQAGQIKHLFQRTVTWEYALCLGDFPVLTVQPLNYICRVHDAAHFVRELEERADIVPVVLPVADRIGVLLSPFLPDIRQRFQPSLFIRGIVYRRSL